MAQPVRCGPASCLLEPSPWRCTTRAMRPPASASTFRTSASAERGFFLFDVPEHADGERREDRRRRRYRAIFEVGDADISIYMPTANAGKTEGDAVAAFPHGALRFVAAASAFAVGMLPTITSRAHTTQQLSVSEIFGSTKTSVRNLPSIDT